MQNFEATEVMAKADMVLNIMKARILPWRMFAFWCVGCFGVKAIDHFVWGKSK